VVAPSFRFALSVALVACACVAAASCTPRPAAPAGTPSTASAAGPTDAPARCQTASAEVAGLVTADQAARTNPPADVDWPRIRAADLVRRTRVSELFGAGCLSSAEDYGSAALIFQHGAVSDDYKQAFDFASRAVLLGDGSKRDLMALAVDRYLVSTKHKQLFASQFTRRGDDPCWCLHQVEPSFPDAQRVAYVGKTLEEERHRARTMNASTSGCTRTECDEGLLPTPQGSVPGVW
jgi:hypothetical protein